MSEFPELSDYDIMELWDVAGGSCYRFARLIRDRLKLRFENPGAAKVIDQNLCDVEMIPDGAKPNEVARWKAHRQRTGEAVSFEDWRSADLKARRIKHLSGLGSKLRKQVKAETRVQRIVDKINRKAKGL